jgi:hypothetical protein
MDAKQIKENRRVIYASTIESPYVPVISDGDADFAERLYDQLPTDSVGLLPKGTKSNGKG